MPISKQAASDEYEESFEKRASPPSEVFGKEKALNIIFPDSSIIEATWLFLPISMPTKNIIYTSDKILDCEPAHLANSATLFYRGSCKLYGTYIQVYETGVTRQTY